MRTLRRDPAFTITAMLTIALGIGSSTAIFSVVNAVLLRPLPYANADRLAIIWSDLRARSAFSVPLSAGDFADVRTHATAFEAIAGFNTGRSAMIGPNAEVEQVTAAFVTSNFFTTLGTRVVVGRGFLEADGAPTPLPVTGAAVATQPAGPPQAQSLPTMTILSHGFWQRRLGGDSSIIGKTIQLNRLQAHIVGIAEPGAKLLFPPDAGVVQQPDVYGVLRTNWNVASRENGSLRLVGRLKPGVTIATAQAQMDGLAADLRARFPGKQTASFELRAEPMQRDIVKEIRPKILALMGAVTFVLLIACANVANLFLVRAMAHERELAVRAALGGSRGALIGQLLAESCVLAVGGAVLGLLLAELGIDMLLAIAPPTLPLVEAVSLDPIVLGFTVVAGCASAVTFGLVPALRVSRPNLAETLRASGRTPELRSGKAFRHGVVVAEVALSFVLLIGSGLMLRSFVALSRVDPGFEPNGLLTFFAFNSRARSTKELAAFMRTIQQRLATIPGVTAASAALPLPLDGHDAIARWATTDATRDPSNFRQATMHIVLPGYFDVMKTQVIAGRAFTEADNNTASRAIVIDDLLATTAFPGERFESIVGRQLFCRINTPEPQMYQVLGVVKHQRHLTLSEPGRAGMFTVDGMWGFGAAARWIVRTSGDPNRLVGEVRAAVGQVSALIPIGDMKPMNDYVDRATAPTRFALILIGVFGVVAVLLTVIGLYGVLSTNVRQRTAEIGLRVAFGAPSETVFRLVIGEGLALSGIGIGIGFVGALAITRVMERAQMLISITPTDPFTYASIAALFLLIATLACWIPAHRAANIDPMVALREE